MRREVPHTRDERQQEPVQHEHVEHGPALAVMDRHEVHAALARGAERAPARLVAHERARVRREVVRLLLFRGTVHLVSAADCLALRPLAQPAVTRLYLTPKVAAGVPDPESVAAHTRELLDEDALTPAELGERLARRWPDSDAGALANVAKAVSTRSPCSHGVAPAFPG